MIRNSPVEAVLSATVAKLRSSTGVTGLVTSTTGIYNNVEQGASYPYIEVTSPVDSRLDTMSRFGSDVLVNIKAVSQARGDKEAAQVLDQCVRSLNFAVLSTTAPHASIGITWENSERYAETINGVTTRYHVGMFRVWAEQTS